MELLTQEQFEAAVDDMVEGLKIRMKESIKKVIDSTPDTDEASETHFLRYFYENADLGPANAELRRLMKVRFEHETEKKVPARYKS